MSKKAMKLDGAAVVITGASHGIGGFLSRELALKGATLIINARNAGDLERVRRELEEMGAEAHSVAGDASEERVAAELAHKAGELGNLTGFVHAAGVLKPGPHLWELDEESFREIMNAGPYGAYQLVKHLIPLLKERAEGFAVFFGSGAADLEAPGIAAYCVAKAALESLARQLAAEAPEIASLIFRPGMVDTRMHEEARNAKGGAGPRVSSQFRAYKQMGYLADPKVVARDLADLLEKDLSQYQGKIVSWSELTGD